MNNFKEKMKSFIGEEIEVSIGDNSFKTVKVKDVNTNSKGDTFFITEDGEIYSEDDVNFEYDLTPGAVLMLWLVDNGYIKSEEMFERTGDEYSDELNDLFKRLEKHGFVKYQDND